MICCLQDLKPSRMHMVGLSPYWFNASEGNAVLDTVDMQSLFLLTGPNGGGKSSLLRSICAAALLGICGFMVPAESAEIPHFDSVMLHMKSYDSPADSKSSFHVEMSEIPSVIAGTTRRSLVLVDEICRGTETAKGTCIAGSITETLDDIGCLEIVSTHLHGLFTLPLKTKNMVYRAMGTVCIDGQTKPTWKLIDGICKESLAFETAKREGVPEMIIKRAEELYFLVYAQEALSAENDVKSEGNNVAKPDLRKNRTVTKVELKGEVSTIQVKVLEKKVADTITIHHNMPGEVNQFSERKCCS